MVGVSLSPVFASALLLLSGLFAQDDATSDTPLDAVATEAAAELEATDVEPGAAADAPVDLDDSLEEDLAAIGDPADETASSKGGSKETTEGEGGTPLWLTLLIVAACLILPMVIGSVIAKQLRLKEYGGKLGLTLLAITLAAFPFVRQITAGNSWKDAIRLGIDLEGGANMVFAVDKAKLEKDLTPDIMERMVGAIDRRIDPAGTQELTVRRVGDDRIEVIVPGADPERVETIKARITRLGSLEFAILADLQQPRHKRLIERANQEAGTEVRNADGEIIGLWRQIAIRSDGTEVNFSPGPGTVYRSANRDGEEVTEYLLEVSPDPERRITGRLLERAFEDFNPSSGAVVGFQFNTRGGSLFQQLTTKYKPVLVPREYYSRLAILLDDRVQSAPTINDVITNRGTISGDFTKAERDSLINVLNAGALEVPLIAEPVFESTVSPLLGADVQEKGKIAIGLATVVVFLFMLLYYRKAGFVADLCLFINIVLVLGVMALIEATFTLPGLAGLVLTIGMAVDANVLIFERIREERAKGASVRMAINNGFSRAFTTIVDANVTTLITAVVLYMIGTDTIKGFAVTLFIGIVMSMFTALYVGRMVFEIAEKKRWFTDLSMASIVGKTEISFLSYRPIAAVISAILIAVGLAAFISRGAANYDIDFRGGSMVTFRAIPDEGSAPLTLEAVRELVEAKTDEAEAGGEPFDVTIEELSLAEADGSTSELYRLRTTNNDPKAVSALVAGSFKDSGYELPRQEVTIGTKQPIAVPEDEAVTDAFAGGFAIPVETSRQMTPIALQTAIENELEQLETEAPIADGVTYVRVDAAEQNAESAAAEAEATTRFIVRTTADLTESEVTTLLENTVETYASTPFFVEVNTFDSAVAGETRTLAILAMVVSLVAIIAYIWVRFQRITFGFAAVAALIHDVLVVLGAVAIASLLSGTPLRSVFLLEDFKINLPMIAAFLTIVGYSLNDTIVVFDRIREVRGKNPRLSREMIDTSLNQTLARTLLTSITTFLVVFILYVLGGEGIHGFAFCLLMGVLVGTYSSIYVASPVLLWLTNGREEKPDGEGELATT